ncbi:MAG: flagellar basal body L-ring protein FlgH [Fibrobacterota bacterium]
MKKVPVLLFVFFISVFSIQNNVDRGFSPYGDKKTKRIDDIITVLIEENSKAENNSQTAAEKENSVDASTSSSNSSTGFFSFLPSFKIGAGNSSKHKGQGKTSKKDAITAMVSARVIRKDSNGNLLIKGSKRIEVNQSTEVITISGIIRAEDITSDNTVFSSKVADAKITYSGEGVLHNAQRVGIISRVFNWIF